MIFRLCLLLLLFTGAVDVYSSSCSERAVEKFTFQGKEYAHYIQSATLKNQPGWDKKSAPTLSLEKAKSIAGKAIKNSHIKNQESVLYSLQIKEYFCEGVTYFYHQVKFVAVKDRLPFGDYFVLVFFDGSAILPTALK